jgi:hypothetical protein
MSARAPLSERVFCTEGPGRTQICTEKMEEQLWFKGAEGEYNPNSLENDGVEPYRFGFLVMWKLSSLLSQFLLLTRNFRSDGMTP